MPSFFYVGFARECCYLNVTKDENFLGLFAWVWVKAYFLLESPFIDLLVHSFVNFAFDDRPSARLM